MIVSATPHDFSKRGRSSLGVSPSNVHTPRPGQTWLYERAGGEGSFSSMKFYIGLSGCLYRLEAFISYMAYTIARYEEYGPWRLAFMTCSSGRGFRPKCLPM